MKVIFGPSRTDSSSVGSLCFPRPARSISLCSEAGNKIAHPTRTCSGFETGQFGATIKPCPARKRLKDF